MSNLFFFPLQNFSDALLHKNFVLLHFEAVLLGGQIQIFKCPPPNVTGPLMSLVQSIEYKSVSHFQLRTNELFSEETLEKLKKPYINETDILLQKREVKGNGMFYFEIQQPKVLGFLILADLEYPNVLLPFFSHLWLRKPMRHFWGRVFLRPHLLLKAASTFCGYKDQKNNFQCLRD